MGAIDAELAAWGHTALTQVVDSAVRNLDGLDAAGLPTFAVAPIPRRDRTRNRVRSTSSCSAAG